MSLTLPDCRRGGGGGGVEGSEAAFLKKTQLAKLIRDSRETGSAYRSLEKLDLVWYETGILPN